MRITNSFGVKYSFRYYQSNRDSNYVCKECEYYKIISTCNKLLLEKLFNSFSIKFPLGLGKLKLVISYHIPRIKDNKLIGLPPVDWKATKELWEQDNKSKTNKTLIRHNRDKSIIVKYSKRGAIFKNKYNYTFYPNRMLKMKLKERVDNGLEIYYTD